ncbi:unnamed protein product [Parnassius apollo]|uniref:(apollo) hypothetical protein n=1 Tax=Parnassius apollo TaxID=110799 RepID=A0A8S3WCU6_PARAO|nr:unnamed protein product [Parnassius apollo]
MTIIYQVISTVIVSYVTLTLGIIYTWPSSTLLLFSSENTTLNRPMTETEVSLFGSISFISAMISMLCSGYLLDKLGRKYSCILFSLLQVLAWVIVAVCYKVEAIIASVILSGLSGCMMLIVPVYISEFCQESIRGTMTSAAMVFYGIGILVSYLMGGYLAYDTMNYSCLSMTVLGVVILMLMKESPMHLMSKGLEKEASRVIAYYRGVKITSKIVEEEMQKLRKALNPELDDLTPEVQKLQPSLENKPKISVWKFFKKSQSTRLALMVSIVLNTSGVFQGLMVVQVYAVPMFAEAVPTMSPVICSVILAVVIVVSGFVGAFLVDWAGRRSLMIYASIASGVNCLVLGTQIHLHWGPHWMTALFIYLFVFTYTCGAGTVPSVVVAEVFLPEIKSLASMIAVEWGLIFGFVAVFLFNPLVEAIGLGPVFYIFMVACFLSAIFCFFFLPETKGLTVDVIQNLFAKKCTQEH